MNKQAKAYKSKSVAKLVADWKGKGEPLTCFAGFRDAMKPQAETMALEGMAQGFKLSALRLDPVGQTAYIFMRDAHAQLVREIYHV